MADWEPISQPYFAHVVGIDTSMTNTGIVLHGSGGVSVHNVKSKGKADDTWTTRHDRLVKLAGEICELVPFNSLVVIEAPAYNSRTGHQHDRSGLWWLVYDELRADRGCIVVTATPQARMTYATGKGNSGKDVVLAAVVKRYADIDVTDNNVADAVVLMAIGRRLDGNPIDSLPATHLRAMAKVALP